MARKQCVGRNNAINKLGKVRRPTNPQLPRGREGVEREEGVIVRGERGECASPRAEGRRTTK